ncbi:ubiquitin c-terminal hydrolase domain-containing protein [Colletotrichum truncatum]|uniref:Ubiquitin c-terminal hydrolase domain-containing protein n=1 Tax=Colletotrichum truncatum TaxID=5467 RepID=A0ACC3ZC81_COLTU|nr:ubiquitin c-terminal hydrolase domain-containing protein [Colletotrichum truncatum]KAF6797685.1 ubiquitin c-terminal hydrolase domain-containing protein [Colletotrichum truncatum]
MSSTASSATRTVLGGGGSAMPSGNALHSFAMGGDGASAGRGGKPPLPHIDDLTSASPDVDMKLPLRKILEKGDNAMRQAETFRDFGRPDLAFKEYIKASLIAVRYVPQHPDALSVRGGHGDMSRIYTALMKKIDSQHGNFEKIKADIIADNQRTGVKRTTSRPSSMINGEVNRPMTPQGHPGTPVMSPTRSEAGTHVNGSPSPKSKPTVQPKPQALLGNSIRSGTGAPGGKSKVTEDLAARFANLRGPVPLPGQDPRIRTHPIVPPRPAGPRAMPTPEPIEKPKVALVTNLPDLPKMPDAIYSPARGTVSNEAASLPSSTPRGLFSRTGSSATINTVLANSNKSSDYFAPSHPVPNANSVPVRAPSISIPEGDTITAEDLMNYTRRGSATLQVLIIDVRSRDDFDEGHILSQAVICIEPSILLRENISSEQIAESMVLSPAQEYHHFERRDVFDLVVFHDQDSDSIPRYISPDMDAAALLSLQRALTYFNYGKELKNPPKLLQGGLDAWTDLVGRSALATSQTAGAVRAPRIRSPLKPTISISKPNRQYKVTPLKPEEVKLWEETLHNADLETARSPGFMHVRSTEEFLRRFPAVSTEQESMQSPVSPDRPTHSYGQNHVDIYSDLPSPPTRPAPAVPRPSYSGLSQTQDDHEAPQGLSFPAQARNLKQGPLARPDSPSVTNTVKDGHHITGLNNPGVWCYANSSIQALRMSPGFGKELATFEWQNTYKVPKKADEKNDPPQLMSRILSNLFHWLDSGKFDVMKAQTLMDYSRSVCEKSRIKDKGDEFGGNRQQDAQEFMSWLMAYLHEETNMRRDRSGDDKSSIPPQMKGGKSMLQGAYEWWGNYSKTNLSIVDKYWRGLELSTVVCSRCHNRTYNWATFDFISVPINGGTQTIEDCMRSYIEPETLPDYKCDNCNMNVQGRKQIALARLPELLCLSFRRFDYDSTLQVHKKRDMITWDFNNLNLDAFFIPPEERNTVGPPLDEKFELPFDYECYAVIIHTGTNITSGHYYAYVREPQNPDPHAWYRISDARVTPVRIDGTGRGSDASRDVFKKGTSDVPYLVFFRRKQGRTRR